MKTVEKLTPKMMVKVVALLHLVDLWQVGGKDRW
jgi:hypothetical protein